MSPRRVRITVKGTGDTTRFTRITTRSLAREIKLLWLDYPEARSIEVEVLA